MGFRVQIWESVHTGDRKSSFVSCCGELATDKMRGVRGILNFFVECCGLARVNSCCGKVVGFVRNPEVPVFVCKTLSFCAAN